MSGSICTFYSYKGGVGRSFALANVAALLAQWGHKVLCVDWDLEAPGLHLYFQPHLAQPPERGVVELVADLAGGRETPLSSYVTATELPDVYGRLDVMAAGRLDDGYVGRVQALDWDRLYADGALGDRLEDLRAAFKRDYDFVLLDSRTGITDVGGICTVQLPDMIAFCFTPNHQSLDGVLNVMDRAAASRQRLPFDRAQVPALPVITRFEATIEVELARKWMEIFESRLGPMLDPWKHRDVKTADLLTHLRVPHVAHWSFGERLPVIEEGTADPLWIGYAFETLAAVVANGLERTELLTSNRQAYVEAAAAREPIQFDVFIEHGPSDAGFAGELSRALEARGVQVGTAATHSRDLVVLSEKGRFGTYTAPPNGEVHVVEPHVSPPSAAADLIALRVLARLSELRPDDRAIRRRSVELLIATGDLDQARSLADDTMRADVEAAATDWVRAVELYRREGAEGVKLARALAALHRRDEAIALLSGLVSRDVPEAPLALAEIDARADLATEIVETRRRALGPLHPETLRAQDVLARLKPRGTALFEQGQSIRQLTEELGPLHRATLEAKATLADLAEDAHTVPELRREVFTGLGKLLGPDRPETLHAGFRLIDSTDETDLGLELLRRAREHLSPGHPVALEGALSVSGLLLRVGRIADAAEVIEHELADARARLGDDHALVIALLGQLAAVHRARGFLEEARALAEQILESRRRVFGEGQPETLAALSALATTYQSQGDLDGALRLRHETLEGCLKLYGPDDARTVRATQELALTMAELGDFREAERLHEEVLDWRREHLGPTDPETINALQTFGEVLELMGDHDHAAECFHDALDALRRSEGSDHPDALVAQQRYGEALVKGGDADGGREEIEQAVRGLTMTVGPKDRRTLDAQWALFGVLREIGDFVEAGTVIADVVAGRRAVYGDRHTSTVAAMQAQLTLLDEMGETDAATLLRRRIAAATRTA